MQHIDTDALHLLCRYSLTVTDEERPPYWDSFWATFLAAWLLIGFAAGWLYFLWRMLEPKSDLLRNLPGALQQSSPVAGTNSTTTRSCLARFCAKRGSKRGDEFCGACGAVTEEQTNCPACGCVVYSDAGRSTWEQREPSASSALSEAARSADDRRLWATADSDRQQLRDKWQAGEIRADGQPVSVGEKTTRFSTRPASVIGFVPTKDDGSLVTSSAECSTRPASEAMIDRRIGTDAATKESAVRDLTGGVRTAFGAQCAKWSGQCKPGAHAWRGRCVTRPRQP